jgi:hypothetical protein
VSVAEAGQGVGLVVAIADQGSQLDCTAGAGQGSGEVAELAVTVAQAVPGGRFADLVAEVGAQLDGLLAGQDRAPAVS